MHALRDSQTICCHSNEHGGREETQFCLASIGSGYSGETEGDHHHETLFGWSKIEWRSLIKLMMVYGHPKINSH